MAAEQEDNELSRYAGPMKLIFNYNNIFYSFFYDNLGGCIHRSREFALNYVHSGEMILDNGSEKLHVRKGECVFIPRDHHITMYKKTQRQLHGTQASGGSHGPAGHRREIHSHDV